MLKALSFTDPPRLAGGFLHTTKKPRHMVQARAGAEPVRTLPT